METVAFRWFSLVYPSLGFVLLAAGIWIWVRRDGIIIWISHVIREEQPPALWVTLVRSLFLLTLPSLFFSFFPFSLPEFLFSIWCLVIVYTLSQVLVHWNATAKALNGLTDELPRKLRFTALNMISVGVVLFLLFYHLSVQHSGH